MLIAHRGKVYNNIEENTIESFIEAEYDNIYGGFELDIRETYDKKIVVCHNMIYNGYLISKSYYKDLGLPMLEDILSINFKKKIIIDIKDKYIDLDILDSIINKYKDKDIYLMSFYNDVINKYIELYHSCKCGILNYLFNKELSYNKYDFVGILYSFLTDNIIEYFKKRKIEVFCYGIINRLVSYNYDIYYIIDNNNI